MNKQKLESISAPDVIVELNNGEYLQFNMSLPLQILFDDVLTFVSETEF